MKQYIELLNDILVNGEERPDRTGTGTINLFGRSIRHNYSDGFPLLTTKKMFTKGIIGELIWFLKSTEDASFLIENNIHIWDGWMKDGEDGKKILPHTYGVKWRNFDGYDQIDTVINQIKNNPYSRRHVVSAWDPRNIENAALPWCHVMFQLDVMLDKDKQDKSQIPQDGLIGDLSISFYQRSLDAFLGGPFNICSYSFLCYMIASLCNLRPKELYSTFGNCHIYQNHIEQCKLQTSRTPHKLPSLEIVNKRNSIDDFEIGDFKINDYKHYDSIKAEVAI